MGTSWNAFHGSLHDRRQDIVTERTPGATGIEEAGIPREPELTSML